jgi:hypothetical protein
MNDWDWDFELEAQDRPPDTSCWVDQSGKTWKVREMAESHLSNCINFLRRQIRKNPDYEETGELWIKAFETELERRRKIREKVFRKEPITPPIVPTHRDIVL